MNVNGVGIETLAHTPIPKSHMLYIFIIIRSALLSKIRKILSTYHLLNSPKQYFKVTQCTAFPPITEN